MDADPALRAGTLGHVASSLTNRGSTRAWRALRRYVLLRDKGRCYRCGRTGADSVDHVLPRSKGGGDGLDNLAAAHLRCNIAKGDRVAGQPAPSRRW